MKNLLLVLALVFSATLGYTQRLDTIFNGCLERVTQTAILGSNQYEIKGNFYNWSGTFDGTEIPIGTPSNYYILVESSGFAFEMPIVNVIGSGSVMILEVEDIGGLLGGVPGAQAGIYRRMPNCNYIPDIQCLNNTTRAHAMVHNFIKLDSACTNAGIPQVLTVTDNTTYANIAISDTTSSFNLYEGSNITLDISGNDITINAAAEGSSDGVVTPTGSGYTSETLTLARTQGLPAITIGIPQVGVKTQGTLVDSDPVAIDFGPNFTVTQALADVTVTVDFPDDSNTNEIQTLSWDAGTAGNDEITLSDGGGTITITDDVNDADASATNELQIITRTAGTNGNDVLTLSVNSSNDAIVDNVVNSASFATNSGVLTLGTVETADITVNLDGRYSTTDTDDQNLGLSGTTNPTVTITDGTGLTVSGINGIAVTNATGTLQIDGSGITGSTDYINSVSMTDADADDIWDISLTGIGNAGASTTVNLSQYLDNTDAQDLSLSGNILSVTNDPTADVDLSQYLDNTDTQNLGLSGVDQSTNPQITITDGTSLSTAGINGIVVRNNGGTLEIDGSAVSGTFNSFDITDGVTTETVEDSDVVTFGVLANATNTLAVDVSPTDAVDIGFNTSGASNGQVLKFNGTSVEWAADNSAASGMGSFLYTDGTSTVTITDGQSIGVTAGTLIDATLSGNNIVVGLDNTVGANDQVITKVGGTWVAADLPADDAGTDDQNLVFDVTTDPAVPTLEIETGGGDLEFLANNLLTVSGQNTPNQLTYGIDPTGATNGQVITYQTVGGVQWADASSGADGYLQGVTPSIPSTDVVELDFDLNGATDVNDIQFSIADSDANPSNEIQDLTWSAGSNGNDEITLTNGGSTVTITDDTGTDDQSISIADGNNPLLTLESGGTLRLTGGGATTISAVNSTGVITISSTDDSGTDDQTISVADAVSNPTIALESGGTIDLAGGGATSVSASGGVITITSTDNNTQLTQEQVQDFIGPLVSNNTETLISVEYNDTGDELNFVVEDDLFNYDNSVTQFISDVTIDVTDGTNVTGISNGDVITFTEDNVVSVVENAGEITIGLDNNQGSDGQVIKKIAGVWSVGSDNVSGGGDSDGVVDGMSLGGAPNYTLTLSRTEGLNPLTQNLSALSDAWTIKDDADNTEVISSATVDFTGLTGISTAWDALNNELEITNTAPESTSVDDTPTLDLTLNAGQITGAVEISGTSGNRITAEADGLYVPAEVDGSTTNEIQNLFQSITDGTTSAIADGSTDEFKLRSANSLLTIVTANDDVTHGDNALFSIDDDLANYDNSVTQFLQSETQNLFETITVGGQSVTADNTTDDVEFIADGDITITPNTTNDKITFSVTNTVDTDTRVNLANDANSITNATLLTFNPSDFNSSVNGSEMTIQLADGTDNNNYVTGLVMTDDDNDDEWEITVSRLGLAAIEEVVNLSKYLDDTDTRTTITDGTTSLSNAENLVFDPLDFNVSANATDFSVGINFPVDQNDNNYITGFTMLDGDGNDVWDITITRDGLGSITEAVNLSKYLDDTDTRVNITGDGSTTINEATDLVFNSTHFNVSANSGEMTVSLADAVDNNNYATGITMTDANNDDVWDITVARNGLADLTETVNLGEYVNTDNQSMSVDDVNNPTLTLTDEGSGSTVQFTGGDNITTTGSGTDNVTIDWAANLPELSDVPAYPTATTVNYVLLHDDNTGTNSWVATTNWDTNVNDDFSGLFTDLDFTGTTGFDDNVDNVGPTYDSGHGIEVDNTADEINLGFTSKNTAAANHLTSEVSGTETYIGIDDATNGDALVILDGTQSAGTGNAYPFRIASHTFNYGNTLNNIHTGIRFEQWTDRALSPTSDYDDDELDWEAGIQLKSQYGSNGIIASTSQLKIRSDYDIALEPASGQQLYFYNLEDDAEDNNTVVLTMSGDAVQKTDLSALDAGSLVASSSSSNSFTLTHNGVTPIDFNFDATTLSVLSFTGVNATNVNVRADDPNGDRIVFWDESDNTTGALDYLTVGTGLTISNSTLNNTVPDVTVTFDDSDPGITISGTYPNFTVTNDLPEATTVTDGNTINFTLIGTDITGEVLLSQDGGNILELGTDNRLYAAGDGFEANTDNQTLTWNQSTGVIGITGDANDTETIAVYNGTRGLVPDDDEDVVVADEFLREDGAWVVPGDFVYGNSNGFTDQLRFSHNGGTQEVSLIFGNPTSDIFEFSVLGTAAYIDVLDAGDDKIVFWDDTESRWNYMTIGSGLTLTGTTLTADGDGFQANTDETVKVSSNETSAGYLENQIEVSNVSGTALSINTNNEGANEILDITLTPANLELDLSLTGNILELTHDVTTVNLAPYLDNTDNQTLTVNSTISNPTVTLSRDDAPSQIQLIGSGNTTVSADGTNITISSTTDDGDISVDAGTGNNAFLNHNSGETDIEFTWNASTSNVFGMLAGVNSISLLADDPSIGVTTEDRIVGWDDSQGKMIYFDLGSGLNYSNTNIVLDISSDNGIGIDGTNLELDATKALPSINEATYAGNLAAGGIIAWDPNLNPMLFGEAYMTFEDLQDLIDTSIPNTDNQTLTWTQSTGNIAIGGGNNQTIAEYNGTIRGLVPDRGAAGSTTTYLRADGSWQVPPTVADNQNLTITGTGPNYTIDIDSGSDVIISAGTGITLSEPVANTLQITASTNTYTGHEGISVGVEGTSTQIEIDGSSIDDILLEADLNANFNQGVMIVDQTGVLIADEEGFASLRELQKAIDSQEIEVAERTDNSVEIIIERSNNIYLRGSNTFLIDQTNGTSTTPDTIDIKIDPTFFGNSSGSWTYYKMAYVDSLGITTESLYDPAIGGNGYDYAMIPRVWAGKDGALYQVFRVGNNHTVYNDDGWIYGRKSEDGGNTWTGLDGTDTETVILQESDFGGNDYAVNNVSGFTTPTGRLIITYGYYDKNNGSGSLEMLGHGVIWSDDNGLTWSNHKNLGLFGGGINQGPSFSTECAVRPDGSISVPINWKNPSGDRFLRLIDSYDNGENWVIGDTIFDHINSSTAFTSQTAGTSEPVITDFGDGIWGVIFRNLGEDDNNRHAPGIAFSFDYGDTWSGSEGSLTWDSLAVGAHGSGYMYLEGTGVTLGENAQSDYDDQCLPHLGMVMHDNKKYIAVLYFVRDAGPGIISRLRFTLIPLDEWLMKADDVDANYFNPAISGDYIELYVSPTPQEGEPEGNASFVMASGRAPYGIWVNGETNTNNTQQDIVTGGIPREEVLDLIRNNFHDSEAETMRARTFNYTASGASLEINFRNRQGGIHFVDMTSANSTFEITDDAMTTTEAGIYTIFFQNISSTKNLNFPSNWLDQTGSAFDGGSTYTATNDFWITGLFDGTNFYVK
jgi:hypothetical protein